MRKKRSITKTSVAKRMFLFLAITAGLLTSCKDYDDDIDKLQEQIDGISADLKDIQDLAAAGKFVQKVETTSTGIKITFSDNTTATINNGTNGADGEDGADGTSSVCTIGENGNWFINGVDTGKKAVGTDGEDGLTPQIGENGNWWIGETDTEVKAAGVNGEDGLTPFIGLNGNWWIGETDTNVKAVGIDGLTPRVGENGNWWIGDFDTEVLANPGSIFAELSSAGTYYTIVVINQDGEPTSIAIPVASQYVSSIVFVPTYASQEGAPYIYAPILKKGSTLISKPTVTLTYQVNPASVAWDNFDIKGLSKQTATVMTRATNFIGVASDPSWYSTNGRLQVKFTGDLENSSSSKLDYYALVLQNASVNEDDAAEYVYSNYVFADFENVDTTRVTISKTAAESYDAIGVSPSSPDWSVGYKSEDGINFDVTSYYIHGASTKVELADFFTYDYSYALVSTSSYSDNAYFVLDGNNIKVKDNQAAAVNKVAKVTVKLKINNTIVKTGTIYVKALDREITTTKVDEQVLGTYYRGNPFNVITVSEDLLINAIDNSGLSYAAATVSNVYLDSDGSPVTGISFVTATDALVAGETVTLSVAQTVPAGTYNATRTYQTTDGDKFYIKYTFTVADGSIDWAASKVSSYWNSGLTSMYVYGKQSGSSWSLEGDLDDGFDFATMIPAPVPSTGSALSIASYSYAITSGSYPVTIDPISHVIKLTGSYPTYVEGTSIPVTLTVNYKNDASSVVSTYTHDFNVQFKNPIKIEYSSTIDILNQQFGNFTYYTASGSGSYSVTHNVSDYADQSPWSGIKVTNLATGQTLTDYDDLRVLINISSISQTPNVSSNLDFNWNQFVTGRSGLIYYTPSEYTLGYVTWDYTGTVLVSDLNVSCNITYTTSWGQSFTTTDSPLKVTVSQP